MQPSNERFQAPMFFLVIPCFNEEEVLHETASRLRAKFDQLIQDKLADPESRVLFVDEDRKSVV